MSTQTIGTERGVETSKALNYALWAVQIAVAGMFFLASFGKLSGDPQMVATFDAIGIGQWFRYVTGGIEVIAAILLLIPAFSGIGGLLLVPTMVGAVITHAFIIGGSSAPAAVLLLASSFVAWGRWPRTRQFLGL